MNRRAVDVSPGIAGVGLNDGATQKATQGFKPLEAHKTRWAVVPSESYKRTATPGRAKYRGLGDRAETKASLVGVLVLLKGSSHVYKTANGREHQ